MISDKIITAFTKAMFFAQTYGLQDSGGNEQLYKILQAVFGTLSGLATLVCAIAAVRAGMKLAHASDDQTHAEAKRQIINCVIGLCICAVALIASQAIFATASSWGGGSGQ